MNGDIQGKSNTWFNVLQWIYFNYVILFYVIIIQPMIVRATSDNIIRVFQDIPRMPIILVTDTPQTHNGGQQSATNI